LVEILKSSTGYKRLDVYILMNVIQLETLVFCRRFLDWKTEDPCGRQFDQMTQAARSGVKNLTEGCEREATSAQTTLKLLDVAKASLCELRDDYMTWLLDRDLPPWRQNSPEAQEVYKVLLDKAEYGDDINYDVAVRIIETRRKFAKWFGGRGGRDFDGSRLQSSAVDSSRIDSNRRQSTAIDSTAIGSNRRQSTAVESGVAFANAMLILIGRSLHMLGSLMERLGEEFREEGGFSERLTAARVEAKRAARKPVDEDAPKCPQCGAQMRLRHSARGDFWGCTAYPTCRGTRAVAAGESNRQQSIAVGGTRIDSNRQQSAALESTAIDGRRQQSKI